MNMMPLSRTDFLRLALQEDQVAQDVTTPFFYQPADRLKASLVAKAPGIFCGGDFVSQIGLALNDAFSIEYLAPEGSEIRFGDVVACFSGSALAVLGAERTLLNIVQRLSGIATHTRAYVAALNNASIQILDTRKTTPLWRDMEKYAVRVGGGFSHRRDLSEMVLIKENHLSQIVHHGHWEAVGSVLQDIRLRYPLLKIEVEVGSREMIQLADLHLADVIMLDNFLVNDIADAVNEIRLRGNRAQIEVSGGITLATIAQYSQLPIQRISVGALTHHISSLDMSLLTQHADV